MTPNITRIVQPAISGYLAGTDAISAINTIKSVTMETRSSVSGKFTISGYSGRAVKPIALRYILEDVWAVGAVRYRVAMEVIKLLSSTARHASHVSWEVNVWVATCVGWCVRQEPLVLPDESPRNKIGIRIPTLTIGVASWLRQSLSRNSG